MNLRISSHVLVLLAALGPVPEMLRAGINEWTSLGPYGGPIKALAIDPQNSAIMYAGTYTGIFKTADAAASWAPAGSGVPSNFPFLSGLAIDPQNTTTLYAWGLNFSGLFKTTDGAGSWSAVTLPDRFHVSAAAVDPQSTLYISGTVWKENYSPQYSIILKSFDGGASLQTLTLPDHFFAVGLVIDPRSPDTIYVSGYVYAGDPAAEYSTVLKTTDGGTTWVEGAKLLWIRSLVLDPRSPNTLYAGSGSGIFKSTDGGATWSAASSGLPEGYRNTLALAIDPGAPGTLYAVVGFADRSLKLPQGICCEFPGSIFKSTDAGASWAEVNSGLRPRAEPQVRSGGADRGGIDRLAFDTNIDGDFGPADVGLVVDPANPGTVYVGTNGDGVFKSTDGGIRWTAANTGLTAMSISRVAVAPQDPKTIYAASWTRLFKSEDGGLTWRAGAWGVPGLFVNPFAIDPQDPKAIYAGVSDTDFWAGGLFKSTDGGLTWGDLGLGFAAGSLVIDPQNPSTLYAGANGGLYKTTNQGGSWTKLETGFCPAGIFAFDPHNLNPVYAVGSTSCSVPLQEVYRSEDRGLNWTSAATSGLPARYAFWSLLIDPTAPNILYAGVWNVGAQEVDLYRTGDGAASWNRIGPGSPTAIDPQNGTVYAAIAGSLFRSEDRGASWSNVNTGLPGPAAGFLAFDPVHSNTVYAAGNAGVFVTTFVP
jgi:photosystem II stability/assembly factor-like uncharacterized protein